MIENSPSLQESNIAISHYTEFNTDIAKYLSWLLRDVSN